MKNLISQKKKIHSKNHPMMWETARPPKLLFLLAT